MMPVLTVTFIAFGLMALSRFGHYKDCFSRAPTVTEQNWLSRFAWLLLLGSYSLCIDHFDLGYGSVVFFGVMTISALTTILLLSYQAKRLPMALALASAATLLVAGYRLIS